MIGLVLCGGLGSRMGKDKGLIKSGSNTWAKNAFEILAAFELRVFLSINPNQTKDYSKYFSADSLITDNKSPQKGPLLGILSTHLIQPREDVLVLACDMPFVNGELISQLIDAHSKQRTQGAYVFMLDGRPEPLCAIYTAKALAAIRSLYEKQKSLNYSMKFILDQLEVFKIPVREGQKEFFRNINHPEELNGL